MEWSFSLFLMFVVPFVFHSGIFVALALRFDVSRGKESQYFKSAFLGYTVGVVLTIVVMNWFQAAQVTLHNPLCCVFLPIKHVKSNHFLVTLIWSSDPNYCAFLLFLQPALLYIVPAVIGFLAAHVVWNGEVKPVCSTTYDIVILFALTVTGLISFCSTPYDIVLLLVLIVK